MTNSILQHAPEDVKIAASFMQRQPLDPTLVERVDAHGWQMRIENQGIERTLQDIVTLEARYLEAARAAEQAELSSTNWQYSSRYWHEQHRQAKADADHWRQEAGFYAALMLELDQGSAWQAEHIRQIEEPSARQEAELTMIGHALGVATRERKLAEFERDEAKQAVAKLTRELAAVKAVNDGRE